MRVSVCLGAVPIPEYLDFHYGYSRSRTPRKYSGVYSGIYSYSWTSQTNAPLVACRDRRTHCRIYMWKAPLRWFVAVLWWWLWLIHESTCGIRCGGATRLCAGRRLKLTLHGNVHKNIANILYIIYSGLVDRMLKEAEGKSPWWFRSSEGTFDVIVERMVRKHQGNLLCRWWLR